MDNDSTEQLIPFLRNLADGIENKTIAPQQLQSIGEFFMSYQFREQAIKDSDTSIEEETQFTKEEITKFVSLGWYVYQVLLKKDRLPETE